MTSALGCSISAVMPDATSGFSHVEGTFDVPYFLNDPSTSELTSIDSGGDARIVRDAHGVPLATATRDALFVALVPNAVVGHSNVLLVEYGHGLLQSADEIDRACVIPPVLTMSSAIGVATDAYGLAQSDLGALAGSVLELSRFTNATD